MGRDWHAIPPHRSAADSDSANNKNCSGRRASRRGGLRWGYVVRVAAALAFCLSLTLIGKEEPPRRFPGSAHHDLGAGGGEFGVGLFRGQRVNYEIVDGLAIAGGDMILGTAAEMEASWKASVIKLPGGKGEPIERAAGVADPDDLWPGGVVPFVIDPSLPEPQRAQDAIDHWNNNTLIQLVERGGEEDFVRFVPQAGFGCSSNVGRIGGEQLIRVGAPEGCGAPQLIHEIGHTVGFVHEQQRADRDTFVQMNHGNVDKRRRLANFDQGVFITDDIGPYDYGSIMHYSPFLFSKNAQPVIESMPPGILFGEAETLSAGDIDSVQRLYGQTPSQTVITSVPEGLNVVVDGSTVSTPAAFNWTPGSNHTIEAPQPQTINGSRFVFGRWSDGGSRSHTVTASQNATVFIASYVAEFMLPLDVLPPAGGSISVNPSSPDGFYRARTPVAVQANPAAGFNFVQWFGVFPTFLHGFSSNPANTQVRSEEIEYTAFFDPDPVTTIGINVPGLRVIVDGDNLAAPASFTWDAGSTHTIEVAEEQFGPQQVYKYKFNNWSDGGARVHEVTASAQGETITANVDRLNLLTANVFPPGSGNVAVSPPSPDGDGYYPPGTTVQLEAVPEPGFQFIGWSGDLSGETNPQSLQMNEQRLVEALFLPGAQRLTSGEPRNFVLPAQPNATLFRGGFGFAIDVPAGATALEIVLDTITPGVNVDLFVRQGQDVELDESIGRPVADFSSEGDFGDEMIRITPDSNPPLTAGAYFIAFVVFTTGVDVEATITATVEGGEEPPEEPPAVGVDVTSLSFEATEGTNPDPQTIQVRNSGCGTLDFQVSSNQDWLMANPTQGVSTDQDVAVTVSVNTAGLEVGAHMGELTIAPSTVALKAAHEPPAQSGPVEIPVTLTVMPAGGGPAPQVPAAGIVNSASFTSGAVAADSIVSLFGQFLAPQGTRRGATSTPLPTNLAGTTIEVTDTTGTTREAGQFFVSALQTNFRIPPDTADGTATLTVRRDNGQVGSAQFDVVPVAPGLFAANASGEGVAAARFLFVAANGDRTEANVFSGAPPQAVPIDLGEEGDQVFLLLFGTGFRNASNASATVGGLPVPVLGFVAQGEFVGLDQGNIGPLPRDLMGAGEVDVNLSFDGQAANTVTVRIQ